MATMDAQQIYDNFHTHAKGTQGLAAAQQTAQQLAAKYQDHALTTQQLIDTIQSGWTGTAAEAASQGLAPMTENALTNHQHFGTGQDIVSRQVDSFHTAASQVQPVPPAPSMTDVITAMAAGQNPQPVLDQIVSRQVAQQSNVDVYNRYVAASQYNTANVPFMSSIDTPDAQVSVVRKTSAPQDNHGTLRRSGQSARDTLGRYTPASHPTGRPSPPAAGTAGTGNTTTTSSTIPAPSPTTTPSPAPLTGPVHNGPVPMAPIGATPPIAGDSPPEPGGRRVLPPADGVPGAGGGSGARSGSSSPGAQREGEGIRGGAPGEGAGPRSGATPGAVAEEESMAAQRAATARPVTSAAPMLGGRGGKAAEDVEHKRRYGLDEDGERRFGDDARTAPPVIGETPAEREQRYAKDAARHRRAY
jgi:hypothetical protein